MFRETFLRVFLVFFVFFFFPFSLILFFIALSFFFFLLLILLPLFPSALFLVCIPLLFLPSLYSMLHSLISLILRSFLMLFYQFSLGVCTISYVLLGFGLSFGESGGGFLGTTHLALTDYDNIAWIFFQFTFAATVTAIVSSVMVGRTCYR